MEKSLKELNVLEGKNLVEMIGFGVKNLALHLEEVNDLNVFPVPDGDTGTNMDRTIETGYKGIKNLTDLSDISKVSVELSKGMLLGARGNSGVILSQIFKGFQLGVGNKEILNIDDLKEAFIAAKNQAYSSVIKPVEGTILTVLRESVDKVYSKEVNTLYEFFNELFTEAKHILPKTKEMLDVLKEADVVDSGGAGLTYIFEGFKDYFEGKEIDSKLVSKVYEDEESESSLPELDFSLFNEFSELDYGYCTEFILQLSAKKVEDVYNFDVQEIIDYLTSVGESVVCFKDGTIVKTHVHTKDPGAILSYVRRWGEFLTLKIENMALQHNNKIQKEETKKAKVHKTTAVIAVAQGKGIIEAFKGVNVDEIVDGAQTMNPSSEDFIKAFNEVDADNIVVLPNNSNIILAAEQAQSLYKEINSNVNVIVIKTKNIPQGYFAATMLQFAEDSLEDTISGIDEYLPLINAIEITNATRDTVVNGVEVIKNHFIGILNHNLVSDEIDMVDSLMSTISKIDEIEYKESCIVMFGSLVDDSLKDGILAKIRDKYPQMEVNSIDGGQEVYSFIVSIL